MKADIHPEYTEAKVVCSCGNTFTTKSTKADLHVELCNECHPFYTGKQKLVDTGGRVERFERRYGRRDKKLIYRLDWLKIPARLHGEPVPVSDGGGDAARPTRRAASEGEGPLGRRWTSASRVSPPPMTQSRNWPDAGSICRGIGAACSTA